MMAQVYRLGASLRGAKWHKMRNLPFVRRFSRHQGESVPKYKMRISRLTVDKLGVKLYDKVSAVIAELVANSYDADATHVVIRAPMGEYLATRHQGVVKDKGFTIEVIDDGIGMTPDEVNKFYLVVGGERRADKERGDRSKKFDRAVMGRKGVGKLAPFGICQTIEIISCGGKKIDGKDPAGHSAKGYLTAHLKLEREAILQDSDYDYVPKPGKLDGTVGKRAGTVIILRNFSFRQVPTMDEFNRQLAQRFGVQSPNWRIELFDSTKAEGAEGATALVGQFDLVLMDNTRITLEPGSNGEIVGRGFGPDGKPITGLSAGFSIDGHIYPVRGWVGYAREPYKDDLMAGVRIYCRGKIAAQTNIFNQKAGFTGEHSVRSYLVGEIHADWLDDDEDLIQTDRRDILWSHELGQEFEKWGQAVVKKIGTLSRDPMKKKTWDRFRELAKFEERVKAEFPMSEQEGLRHQAMVIGKLLGQTAREEEINDPEHVESFVQLSLMLAPVVALDEKLREAADAKDSPLSAVTAVLRVARIAELASFGRIADDRVRVIGQVEKLKDDPRNLEDVFQHLIESSPWLIDPQWSPITANQTFTTLRQEFAKYFEERTGQAIVLDDFGDPKKRADFVMSTQDNVIQIIEIKKPKHKLQDDELDRIVNYNDLMTDFLAKKGNQDFQRSYSGFHITLVCDGLAIGRVGKQAFEQLTSSGRMTHETWESFLLKTRKMHEAFLAEADRQKKNAIGKKTNA
jgi:hypothetical protein